MTISLWQDIPYLPRPALEGNIITDSIVLGAGMTGLGLAHFLAERGIRTLVIDGDRVAGGASGRNIGFVLSGLGEHYAGSVKYWGRRQAASILRRHRANHDLLAEMMLGYGIDCGYRRCGSLRVGKDSEEQEILHESARLLAEDGFSGEYIGAKDMNALLDGRNFFGGMYNPADGALDPVLLVRGLARAVEGKGVQILEHSPVRELAKAGDNWRVRSHRGSASAPLLFLAGNAWLPRLRSCIPIRPVRGQCLALLRPPSAAAEMPCLCDYGAEYWRLSGGYAVFGGFESHGGPAEFCDRDEVTGSVQSALESFVRFHFPGMATAPITHRWSGIMGFTPDGLPVVGPMPDEEGLFAAAGYTGHGFGFAFLAARWLVNLAIERHDEIPPYCRLDRTMRPSPAVAVPRRDD
jgi:gamma-glutamylputrescine oxidase